MRAIKINSTERTIEEIDLGDPNKDLDDLKAQIGCETIQLIGLDTHIVMAVDEEGRLRQATGAFRILGSDTVFAGNAVVIGLRSTSRGEFLVPLRENKRSFDMIIEWADPAEIPAPKMTFKPLGGK